MSFVVVDDRMRDALSRLTDNEKLCLRRCLVPQTAKEMAIELGISPHAVEKRLKMARAKLGVSSSTTAARLLEQAEADQLLVPQSPDLPRGTIVPQDVITAAPQQEHLQRSRFGGMRMITPFLLLALVAQDAPVAGTFPQGGRLADMKTRKVDMTEASAFISEGFRFKDIDHSGFLDPGEASAMEPRGADRDKSLPPAPPAGARDKAAERKWMPKLDTNRDGRVSQDEYVSYMMPWILWQGVPEFWHAKR